MAILKVDIRGGFRKDHIYGRAGDEVGIISHHGEVIIVEAIDKSRFAVFFDELTDMPENVCKIIPTAIPEPPGKRKGKKVVAANQVNLF